jgi:branched-chain amino acid transport system permease protein
LMSHGMENAWFCLLGSAVVSGILATLIGWVSLRTKGVYFIMITLAFAQMIYYLINSIKGFGGDEGINLSHRFILGLGENFKKDLQFYWLVLFIVVTSLLLIERLIGSKFGRVLKALKDDDIRVESIGINALKYKLVAFTLSAMLTGVAGALLVNQQKYVGPNVLYWMQSGNLMIMVILGGVGTLGSGLWGAVTLLGLETLLAQYTAYANFYIGWILLAVVLLEPQGIRALLGRLLVWPWRRLTGVDALKSRDPS